jgi:uncharacterized protein
MHPIIKRLLIPLLLLLTPLIAAEQKSATPKPKQFVYMVRLVPRLYDESAWSDADKQAVTAHFERLKAATAEGKVILAGRTREPGDKTFGLVIFEAADDDAAKAFMDSDPAVTAGVMTATVHPYHIALQRGPK